MYEMDITLPRSAFTPREVARAGDVWRAFQDVAVGGSSLAGWPPERYRAEGVSFIVRSMVVVHHRETVFGEPLRGTTWPSDFKRGMFFRRECRLRTPDGPVASATQQWVHVAADVTLARASDALVACFAVEAHDPPVELPSHDPVDAPLEHEMELECWHTWMDPLGHVNHPVYVDWADEALARWLAARGIDPARMRPVAESARFKSGVVGGERVRVATRLTGRHGDAAVFTHAMSVGDRAVAQVTTMRALDGDGPPLVDRLAG
ncbi:MAG: thioesterase family protein [Sandaracinaceae bacterium]|nr:thioesterase family protein [Sandaracinaceae bacterium]